MGLDYGIDAGGYVSLSASDTSIIDALSISVAGTGGGAVVVALAANVITNTVASPVDGSTLMTDASLNLSSVESAVIRTLASRRGRFGRVCRQGLRAGQRDCQ